MAGGEGRGRGRAWVGWGNGQKGRGGGKVEGEVRGAAPKNSRRARGAGALHHKGGHACSSKGVCMPEVATWCPSRGPGRAVCGRRADGASTLQQQGGRRWPHRGDVRLRWPSQACRAPASALLLHSAPFLNSVTLRTQNCTHACTHICTHTHLHLHTHHSHTYKCTHTCTCTPTHPPTHLHPRPHKLTHTQKHLHSHTRAARSTHLHEVQDLPAQHHGARV